MGKRCITSFGCRCSWCAGASAGEVHEEAKLEGNVECWVRGDPEALVSFAFLVILAHEAVKGKQALEAEGTPGVVEAVWVGKADVAPCGD